MDRRVSKTWFERAAEAWAILAVAVAIIVLAWMVDHLTRLDDAARRRRSGGIGSPNDRR